MTRHPPNSDMPSYKASLAEVKDPKPYCGAVFSRKISDARRILRMRQNHLDSETLDRDIKANRARQETP